MRIWDFVEGMLYSNFLSASSKLPQIRYIGVDVRIMGNRDLLMRIEILRKDASAKNAFDITQLEDPNIYMSSKDDILLLIQAADSFVKSGHIPASFQTNSFYRYVRTFLDKLHDRHLEQDQKNCLTFALYLASKIFVNRDNLLLNFVSS